MVKTNENGGMKLFNRFIAIYNIIILILDYK